MTEEQTEHAKSIIGGLDYAELIEVRREIDQLVEKRHREAHQQAREEMQEIARRYGFRLGDLVEGVGKGKAKGKIPPKYRHPDGHTWTGRGRRPKWVQAWESEGGNIEELRIQE